MKNGRPTKYKPEMDHQCYKLALLGLTNEQMANVLDIDVSTFYAWINEKPIFSEAIKKGKDIADAEVAHSLHKRALGYTEKEQKAFQHEGKIIIAEIEKNVAPDTGAAAFWLKNRQSQKWRNNPVEEVDNQGVVSPNLPTRQQLAEKPDENGG